VNPPRAAYTKCAKNKDKRKGKKRGREKVGRKGEEKPTRK
jgi:hypothetical protein